MKIEWKTYFKIDETREAVCCSSFFLFIGRWPIAVYSTTEQIWEYENVTAAYREEPEVSKARIFNRIREVYLLALEKGIKMVCR